MPSMADVEDAIPGVPELELGEAELDLVDAVGDVELVGGHVLAKVLVPRVVAWCRRSGGPVTPGRAATDLAVRRPDPERAIGGVDVAVAVDVPARRRR